jgi:S1-C subfamily serine protease
MEGNNSKTQGIALGLVLMAVVVTAGGFLYMSRQKEQARAEMQKAQIQEQAPAQSETGLPQAAPTAKAAPVAPAGGGLKSTGCPVTDVGAALGVEVLKGHASCSVGSGAGIEAVSPTGIGGKAGLKEQDVVVYANKTRTECPRDLLGAISANWGKEISLTVERAGKQMKIVLPADSAKTAAGTKAAAK